MLKLLEENKISIIISIIILVLLLVSKRIFANVGYKNEYASMYPNKKSIVRNNPLNIRCYEKWEGSVGCSNGFIKFKTPEYGIRAGMKLLNTYYDKYGIKTPEQIFNRFAPKNENNTEKYINDFVALMNNKGYNITRKSHLNIKDKKTLIDILKTIIFLENSVQPYKNSIFETAYSLI